MSDKKVSNADKIIYSQVDSKKNPNTDIKSIDKRKGGD